MPPLPPLPRFDLYAQLEVDPNASPETIDAAWRSLARRHHPDVANGSGAAQERMRRLNVAHDWLTDPTLRAHYDATRRPTRTRAARAAHPVSPAPEPTTQPSVAQERLPDVRYRQSPALMVTLFYAGCVLWVALAYVGSVVAAVLLAITNLAELIAAVAGAGSTQALASLIGNILNSVLVAYGCTVSLSFARNRPVQDHQWTTLLAVGFLASLAMTFGFPAFAGSYLPRFALWLVGLPAVPAAVCIGVITAVVAGSAVALVGLITEVQTPSGVSRA